jgi:RNA polymerase sigma-32 factor
MNRASSLHALTQPLGSLDAYISQVNQIDMLSAEEEYRCAERFQIEGDVESARTLVLAHLRYVVKVARGYLGYGLPFGDLIQEGNVGLMKAVKRFDPKMGVRLVSFAVHWIKSEIHEFVLRNWRIVKIATTKAQRKLFFNLRKKTAEFAELGWLGAEGVQEVAAALDVSPEEVLTMEHRLKVDRDISYDASSSHADEDDAAFAPAQYLYNPKDDPAYLIEQERTGSAEREGLHHALERLDERSQDILRERWLADNKATLHDLADKYGVSAERVRQLEKNAMKKLKQYMAV